MPLSSLRPYAAERIREREREQWGREDRERRDVAEAERIRDVIRERDLARLRAELRICRREDSNGLWCPVHGCVESDRSICAERNRRERQEGYERIRERMRERWDRWGREDRELTASDARTTTARTTTTPPRGARGGVIRAPVFLQRGGVIRAPVFLQRGGVIRAPVFLRKVESDRAKANAKNAIRRALGVRRSMAPETIAVAMAIEDVLVAVRMSECR